MKAGKLRQQITIERASQTQNEYGEIVEGWETVGTFPASVEPINGREYFAAQAVQSEVTTRIRMRYKPGILVTDRVTHGGTVYNIQSVINPEMRNEELILMCVSNP
jgi:SPP1 family predicted phage head-tail adaptor